jgi:hypothetical protein
LIVKPGRFLGACGSQKYVVLTAPLEIEIAPETVKAVMHQ